MSAFGDFIYVKDPLFLITFFISCLGFTVDFLSCVYSGFIV